MSLTLNYTNQREIASASKQEPIFMYNRRLKKSVRNAAWRKKHFQFPITDNCEAKIEENEGKKSIVSLINTLIYRWCNMYEKCLVIYLHIVNSLYLNLFFPGFLIRFLSSNELRVRPSHHQKDVAWMSLLLLRLKQFKVKSCGSAICEFMIIIFDFFFTFIVAKVLCENVYAQRAFLYVKVNGKRSFLSHDFWSDFFLILSK